MATEYTYDDPRLTYDEPSLTFNGTILFLSSDSSVVKDEPIIEIGPVRKTIIGSRKRQIFPQPETIEFIFKTTFFGNENVKKYNVKQSDLKIKVVNLTVSSKEPIITSEIIKPIRLNKIWLKNLK